MIAPDLLGHGRSDKPRADYSVSGYANGARDLLALLGIERATVVGHSLGGGVALQFAYQYPELTERLILVASGGFGPEVTPLLRAISTPGFHQVTGLLTLPGLRHVGVATLRALAATGLSLTRDLDEVADIFDSFQDPARRAAIAHVVRAAVDWKGQVITLSDRAYLIDDIPMCVVWGAQDHVIPTEHAEVARVVAPHARVEIVPNAGHFPHRDHPERFVRIVRDFIRRTPAAAYDRAQWREHLRRGGRVHIEQAEADHAPVHPLRAMPSA
ncbi:MAG: alpha/beta fold hydrolase [Nocardioides sp.]